MANRCGESRVRQRLVLASASPRRRALLEQIGLAADAIDPADIGEIAKSKESPPAFAERLAREKASAVIARHPDAFVLAADTVVACGRRILPKPVDEAEARACLLLLSGRRHRVHTALAVITPDSATHSRLVTSQVRFKRLTSTEIDAYIAAEDWRDKAGGYAIQGHAGRFVISVNGSCSNVVGLPLYETCALLGGVGFAVDSAAAVPT